MTVLVVALVLAAAAAVDPDDAEDPGIPDATNNIVDGGLSREEIQREVSRSMERIKRCYELELNKDPNLEGKLVLVWRIDGSGAVEEAHITENTIGHAAMDDCVLALVRAMHFPEPKGGGVVNVTYPFVFAASHRPDGEGDPEVLGSMDKRLITTEVKQHRSAIEACYVAALKEHPGLKGKLSIAWEITATGDVAGARAISGLDNKPLEDCVLQVVRGMHFPAPRASPVKVNFPFVFQPSGKDAGDPRAVSVTGPLQKQQVVDVVSAGGAALTACVGLYYTISRVNVRFTIGADGLVVAVATEASSLQNPSADGCIQKTVKALIFPPAAEPTLVFYPLVFVPPDPPEPPAPSTAMAKAKAAPKKEGGCGWPW